MTRRRPTARRRSPGSRARATRAREHSTPGRFSRAHHAHKAVIASRARPGDPWQALWTGRSCGSRFEAAARFLDRIAGFYIAGDHERCVGSAIAGLEPAQRIIERDVIEVFNQAVRMMRVGMFARVAVAANQARDSTVRCCLTLPEFVANDFRVGDRARSGRGLRQSSSSARLPSTAHSRAPRQERRQRYAV